MRAKAGDRITIRGHRAGEHEICDCEVLEVHGADGAPPYLVRWDDGHEAIFFPGTDAAVEPYVAST